MRLHSKTMQGLRFDLLVTVYVIYCLSIDSLAAQERDDTSSKNQLDSDVFSVRSKVNRRVDNGDGFAVYERYSSSQKRALVSYRSQLGDQKVTSSADGMNPLQVKSGVFYNDEMSQFSVLYSDDGSECNRASAKQLLEFLKLDLIETDLNLPSFIVGPSKWLFYVKYNRYSFKIKDLGKDTNRVIRNIKCTQYHKTVTTKSGQELHLNVFFSEYDLATNQHEATPILIDFEIDEKSVASIEFLRPKNDLGWLAYGKQSGIVFDPFILNPFVGCEDHLMSSENVPNLNLPLRGAHAEDTKDLSFRFTFKAEIEHYVSIIGARQYNMFVAYDSAIGQLRVDREWAATGVRSRQVTDFDNGLHYYIVEDDSQQRDPTPQCLVSELSKNAPTKLDLILGSSHAKYLGKGQVRGIDALVYQSIDSLIPLWLEQPVVYKDAESGREGTWDPTTSPDYSASFGRDGNSRIMTIIYVKDSDGSELLLIEIYRMNQELSTTTEKRLINIYDFKWTIGSEASNGDKPTELFTLAELCIMNNNIAEDSDRGQMELLLESTTKPSDSIGQEVLDEWNDMSFVERQLAVMATIQRQLDIQASMTTDLVVRIFSHRDLSLDTTSFRMFIKFRAHQSTKKTVGLLRLGRGSIFEGHNFFLQPVDTLLQCYMEAAKNQENRYFAYDEIRKLCYISRNSVEHLKLTEGGRLFDLQPSGGFEFYETEKDKKDLWLYSRWHTGITLDFHYSIGWRDKILSFSTGPSPKSTIDFKILRMITGSAEKHSANHYTQFKATTRLDELGFVEHSPTSKRFPQATSIAQCRAACYADFQCRSYSVCIQGSEIECILSKMGLETEDKVNAIREAGKKVSNGETFEVRFNEELWLGFRRKAACALYHKFYGDYFEEYNGRLTNDGLLVRVVDSEQCAILYVQYNLRQFSRLSKEISESLATVGQALELFEHGQADEALDLLDHLESYKNPLNSFGSSFAFIDWADIRDSSETIQRQLREYSMESIVAQKKNEPIFDELLQSMKLPSSPVQEGTEINYCMLRSRFSWNDSFVKLLDWDNVELPTRRSNFDYTYLYEGSYGISLRGIQGFSSSPADTGQEKLKEAYEAIQRGDNMQIELGLSKSLCASACSTQQIGPWPACKSFSFVISKNKETDRITQSCFLNSITLKEAKERGRLDLIDDNSYEEGSEHWHFEPQLGFGLSEVSLLKNEEFLLGSLTRKVSEFRFRLLEAFIVLSLGLTCGCYLGVCLGQRYLPSILDQRFGRGSISGVIIDLPEDVTAQQM